MSRTKNLVDGYWYYRIYDAEKHILLAEGKEADVCKKLYRPVNHYHSLVWELSNKPNKKLKYEIIEREWIPYKHTITDTLTNESFTGSKAECREWMEKQMDRKLTDANFINYWYRSVGRFERETK